MNKYDLIKKKTLADLCAKKDEQIKEAREQADACRATLESLRAELKESNDIAGRANLRYMEKCKELDILNQSLPKVRADAVNGFAAWLLKEINWDVAHYAKLYSKQREQGAD